MLGRGSAWLPCSCVYAIVAATRGGSRELWATGNAPLDPLLAPSTWRARRWFSSPRHRARTRIASVAGGAVAVSRSALAWMAGVMGRLGEAFDNALYATPGILARLILPSDVLWRGAAGALTRLRSARSAVSQRQLYKFSPFSGAAPSLLWAGLVPDLGVGALAIGMVRSAAASCRRPTRRAAGSRRISVAPKGIGLRHDPRRLRPLSVCSGRNSSSALPRARLGRPNGFACAGSPSG